MFAVSVSRVALALARSLVAVEVDGVALFRPDLLQQEALAVVTGNRAKEIVVGLRTDRDADHRGALFVRLDAQPDGPGRFGTGLALTGGRAGGSVHSHFLSWKECQ